MNPDESQRDSDLKSRHNPVGVDDSSALTQGSSQARNPGLEDTIPSGLQMNSFSDRFHAAIPFAFKMGVSRRFKLAPKIRLRSWSEMVAPITLPSCEAKLRPPASLP